MMDDGRPCRLLFGLLVLLGCFLSGCDKDKPQEPEKETFIGPGSKGGPSPEPHVGVFINKDGTSTVQDIPLNTCPLIYIVHAGSSKATQACDPKYDYADLVESARKRAVDFLGGYSCPVHCPFMEFYPNEDTSRTIKWECIATVDGDFSYTANYQGYFVCTDTQN